MRLLVATLTLTAAGLLAISPDQAQTPPASESPVRHPPTPEETQQIMQSAFGAMVPMMGKMAEAVINAQLRVAALPATAESIATFKKNLLDELLKKGFKPDQAMQIVLATPIPSANVGGK